MTTETDFNGGRRAHAAECKDPLGAIVALVELQWRAACARRRIRRVAGWSPAEAFTSMEGGVRTPPNRGRLPSRR